MAAFIKIGDIQGQAKDQDHDGWIIFQTMSAPIFRSIPEGARDQQRTQGDTVLGDVVIVRELDSSSTYIQEACAKGTSYDEVEIHLTVQANEKQEPYLKYLLKNVILTGYSFHGNAEGSPLPTEEITLNCTSVEWTYVELDPNNMDPVTNHPTSYNPSTQE